MSRKILIEKNEVLTRIGVLLDEEWIGFYIDSDLEENLQNRIIVGQIQQVVKNLNAVFVDYGEEKNGLLHMKQIPEHYQTRLYPGTRLPVQIVKQNVGEKGHKLTGKVNLKGRHLVCLPFEPGINISKKIQDTTLRRRIKETLEAHLKTDYGFIIRTHAKDIPLEEIEKDAQELILLADQFMQRKDCLSKGSLLYEEPPLALQLIMDYLSYKEPLEIVCTNESMIGQIKEVVSRYGAENIVTLTAYPNCEDLFSLYGLQKRFDNLLSRKVWLKNGGNLIIDYTEAMTIIDVNSAKAVLTKNKRKAVLDLNLLAVKESILQILRRNLSGMILVDLVEMENEEDKTLVYHTAKNLFASFGDKRSKVFPLTELGLLQISRSKKYSSLPHKVLTACESCETPYAHLNNWYQLFLIEKKIKAVCAGTIHKTIFIECVPEIYETIIHLQANKKWEKAYNLSVEVKKMEKISKNMFSCQLY